MEKDGGAKCEWLLVVCVTAIFVPTLPKALFKRMGKLANSMSKLESFPSYFVVG